MAVLGAQEWLRREARRERIKPSGVKSGVVRVCVLVRRRATKVQSSLRLSEGLPQSWPARATSWRLSQVEER